ncbi:TPA: SelT/SelW/SelH family protein [Candidatus Poribacteria bacterium]|nr:SelT/SelW/SelH family protein [Candidatus Poribacteria bacterium]
MPRAASLADDLLSKYETAIKGLTLVPGSGGCFEVSLNSELIFSKREVGQFPTKEQIFEKLP